MNRTVRPLFFISSFILFAVPTLFFLFVTNFIIPYFIHTMMMHPAMAWFIGGSIAFIPIFTAAIVFVRKDGYRTREETMKRFRLKRFSKQDWKYFIGSIFVIGLFTGLIMGVAQLLHTTFGLPALEVGNPPFMKFVRLAGSERWMLLVWGFMFFFNIVGEELFWRGYILPRQEAAFPKHAWMLNSLFWMMFHIGFGPSLMLVLLPIIIILPFAVQRSGNTSVGIVLHALLNGPSFLMITFGIIQ